MKSPDMTMGNPPEKPKDNLKVKAALKSNQAIEKGYNDAFFMDREDLLEDPEIMKIVAKQYPYVLGHLSRLNKDKNFVLQWLTHVGPDKAVDVYKNARQNALRVSLSEEEFDSIIGKK